MNSAVYLPSETGKEITNDEVIHTVSFGVALPDKDTLAPSITTSGFTFSSVISALPIAMKTVTVNANAKTRIARIPFVPIASFFIALLLYYICLLIKRKHHQIFYLLYFK